MIERWYEKRESDDCAIISSRVRLARNLRRYPFPSRLNESGAKTVLAEISACLEYDKKTGEKRLDFMDLTSVPKKNLLPLSERHTISLELAEKKGVKGILKNDDESVCVMINEEDHVRIQAVFAGDDIDLAYKTADEIDDLMEENADIAFDDEWGYLTSCPTNAGTGLRASYMLHLPALDNTGKLKEVEQAVNVIGMTIRGARGEGSDPEGSVFQLSNQTTMGKPEDVMIETLKSVTAKVIEHENNLKENLLTHSKTILEDKIYRAYGVLTGARIIKAPEALTLLSHIRMGFNWGILDAPRPKATIYQMMLECRAAIMERRTAAECGDKYTESDINAKRAEYIRRQLAITE